MTAIADFNAVAAAVTAQLYAAFPTPVDLDPDIIALSALSNASKVATVRTTLVWLLRNGLIMTSDPRIDPLFMRKATLTAEGLKLYGLPASITPLATFTSQPLAATATVGSTATFSVVAAGLDLTYQWKKGGVVISNATSASYTTPVTQAGDDGALFSVDVMNVAGTVTSNSVALTVVTAPTISVQPQAAAVVHPATATFAVTAAGHNLTYQWKKGVTAITGATAASYTTPATVLGDDGASFTVVVTNAAGSVTSSAAVMTVT